MIRFTFQRLVENERIIVIITDLLTGKSIDLLREDESEQDRWMREQTLATGDMDTQGKSASTEHRVLPGMR